MMNTLTVTCPNSRHLHCPFHTPVSDIIAQLPPDPSGLPYLGAMVNNDLCSLSFPVEVDATVEPLTLADPPGWSIYARSASFLLAKAVHDLFPDARFAVSYSVGTGYYCLFERVDNTEGVKPDEVRRIEQHMRALVAKGLPIRREKIAFTRAVELFEQAGQSDRVHLLKYRNPPRVVIHICENFYDLAQGPMAASTGQLGLFSLISRPPGMVLQMPDRANPTVVPPYRDQPQLFHIFQEHIEWGRILGVNTVGRLNEIIAAGDSDEFIHIAEALHEKKVARIADMIGERRGKVKVVLIAGPSSAGKTTLSKRLAIQLRVNGIHTATIGLDNYFHERDRTPRDAQGAYDFEHIDAIDIDLFNRHLLALIGGETVEPPAFNFETKRRESSGRSVRLDNGRILIVEGIHGLNPRLTETIPVGNKFRIYVSAMTQLALDSHNRISTTDNRMIRRLVRDHQFRGHSALETIRMWPSVRRGEERWIFPFQAEADAYFNSALDYELAVLKPMAEPLLTQIKPDQREYAEARRLTAFLMNFLGIPDREVPRTSILREYIGRSGFKY